MIFTWPQWIAVAALMFISFFFGYKCGRIVGRDVINYYRNKWLAARAALEDKP